MKAAMLGGIVLIAMLGCSPSITEQAKLLGVKLFTKDSWRAAINLERGEMVWSFLSQHDIKTVTRSRVIQFLGQPACYSGYDEDLTYCIGPDNVHNGWGKGYLLVFLVTEKAWVG